ncbi:MAG: DUF4269 domain-containing protein [Chloroflexota bacterium]
MSIQEIILYLRSQLLELRGENDRQAISELLSTFKMLTKISFENEDKQLTAVLVDLTDAARDLYMGKPLNGNIPDEDSIRALHSTAEAELEVEMTAAPATDETSGVQTDKLDTAAALPTSATPIDDIEDEAVDTLETHFDAEATLQRRLREVINRDWNNNTPIRDGSPRQMQAYSVVYDKLMLFHNLEEHEPVWVGTFPIGVDTDASDIDIICSPEALRPFLRQMRDLYGEQEGFRLTWKAIDKVPTVLARFRCNDFDIEVFAQPRPTRIQTAFVHMLVEARLLAMGGDAAKERVHALKTDGIDTETAFTRAFRIDTEDPHKTLLEYARLDNDALREKVVLPQVE